MGKFLAVLFLVFAIGCPQSFADDRAVIESSGALGRAGQMPGGVLALEQLEALIDIGEGLFRAKFTRSEGAGRPGATQAIIPTKRRSRASGTFARTSGADANACASCHNDPVAGGAGDFVANAFVSEGFTNTEFDSTDPQFSNERGTNHLFGAGLIELLAREMSADLARIRARALKEAHATGRSTRLPLVTKSVSFGFITAHRDGLVGLDEIEGIDTDLVVRPFSQKGVMTSIRQFTINAANVHHGLQARERFGARWTGSDDHDEDGIGDELREGDIAALVAWQATLRPPVAPATTGTGARIFDELACNSCHIRTLPLGSLAFADPGPLDIAGTLHTGDTPEPAIYDLALLDWAADLPRDAAGQILVPLFGDLKRHKMTDAGVDALGNELLSQRFVDRNIFMTAELWGVGSTAPYGHRNDFTTLNGIILAHGGEARAARDAYARAPVDERQALIDWLRTLEIAP